MNDERRNHTVEGVAAREIVRFARELRKEPTRGERLLWQELRRGGLGVRFRRQHPIDGFILDFYCAEARLAVEVDGASHKGREEHDRWRDEMLAGSSIRVLRFAEDQACSDLSDVIETIRKALGDLAD